MKPKLLKPDFRERLYRRRYLVPNAVTLGNMFCGFLAIIYATSGRFEKAALAIGIAILLDGLDGRVARKLNATSKFGVEFDSFSDLVSFGVAPAILIYNWCFKIRADEFGVIVTFVYALCAASRLARFNITEPTLKNFTGLPTPGAAAVIGALVNFAPIVEPTISIIALGTVNMLFLSYVMVSNIPYFSVKELKIRGIRPVVRLALGAVIALIWYNSGIGLLVLATGYAFSGPAVKLRQDLISKREGIRVANVG